MGQISIITKEQQKILDEINKSQYLVSNFYFTGGTALSKYYLQHRYSDDLDFFSEKKIDQQLIFSIVSSWKNKLGFSFKSRFIEVVYRFEISFNNNFIKLDFGYYPYPRLKTGKKINNINIDSLFDIAVNKLLTINQRTDIKDFVDLYFLLKKFTLWDLIYGVETKFKQKIELLILSEDFLKVDDFQNLPKMIKSLTLSQLKKFFRSQAIKLGKRSVI